MAHYERSQLVDASLTSARLRELALACLSCVFMPCIVPWNVPKVSSWSNVAPETASAASAQLWWPGTGSTTVGTAIAPKAGPAGPAGSAGPAAHAIAICDRRAEDATAAAAIADLADLAGFPNHTAGAAGIAGIATTACAADAFAPATAAAVP